MGSTININKPSPIELYEIEYFIWDDLMLDGYWEG